jgi:hypothetical protein
VSAFSFPFAIGADGSTLQPTRAAHVRQMIEQVLFTRRGERVNRPDFGAGVSELLFSENAPELAAAAQHMVQASLHQWLGQRIPGGVLFPGMPSRRTAIAISISVAMSSSRTIKSYSPSHRFCFR